MHYSSNVHMYLHMYVHMCTWIYTFIAGRGGIQLLWDLTNDTYGLENDEGK